MSIVSSLSLREKALPLSPSQRQRLSEIIASKEVLMEHSSALNIMRKRQDAWEEVAKEFKASYPFDHHRTIQQLKRAWEYVRKLAKKNHSSFIQEGFMNGGEPPPMSDKNEVLNVATGALTEELTFAKDQFDSLAPVVLSEESMGKQDSSPVSPDLVSSILTQAPSQEQQDRVWAVEVLERKQVNKRKQQGVFNHTAATAPNSLGLKVENDKHDTDAEEDNSGIKMHFASTRTDCLQDHSPQVSECEGQNIGISKSSFMIKRMWSGYMKSLSVEQRFHFLSKLKLKNPRINLPDPYKIGGWIDSMKEWPELSISHVHQYLLSRHDPMTESKDTVCASLRGYSAFQLGDVKAVEYNNVNMASPVCLLKAIVVSPFESQVKVGLAWVCLEKKEGTIKTSHCTCLKWFEGVCSHIAGLLFKVEAAVALGMNKDDSDTSSSSKLNMTSECSRSRLCVARVKDTYFTHQDSNKGLRRPLKDLKLQPLPKYEEKQALARLRNIIPSASVFSKDESDTDTASDGEGYEEELLFPMDNSHNASEVRVDKQQIIENGKQQLHREEKECFSLPLHDHTPTELDDDVVSVVSALDFEGFENNEEDLSESNTT